MIKNKTNDCGFALIMALLVVIGLVLVVAFSMTAVVLTERKIDKNLINSTQSYYLAESGIEDAILRVIRSEYDAINNFTLDGADIGQNITQVDDDIVIQSASSYSNNERKLETSLYITTSDIAFHYGVQVDEGGLEMKNGSSIIGNIYSNGTITGATGTTIFGDAFVATGMSLDSNGVWDTYSGDEIFGKANPEVDIAMSFSPSVSENLSQVAFYIKKEDSPSDGTIKIVTDSAGSPSKTELASTTLIASKIGSSYGWVEFSFSSPASLVSGSTYWIVVDVDRKNSEYFYIGKAPDNANSVSKYSPDWDAATPSWTEDVNEDYEYKVWMGGVATSLNSIIVEGNAYANTISNSEICGDAYYETIDAFSLGFLNTPTSPTCPAPLTGGTAHPGNPDPAVEALPISDSNINDWKAAALAGGVYSDAAHCSPDTDISLGPAKLVCDFSPANGIKITLNGTVWIEGNIDLSSNNIIELDSGYGTNSGVIIADKVGSEETDGTILVKNNIVICGSEGYNTETSSCNPSNGSYVLLLSTHSGSSTDAIEVANNADGAIFYAHNGTVNVSNNASLKEVTAYKLKLENNTSVIYESGLANASFSSGPGGGWAIRTWNETQ